MHRKNCTGLSFEVPTDADLRQMEVEVNRELCDAWLEIYVLALREWLDGQ